MAIDRPVALRNAEKLLRQGKLDAAIAEYLRVVEDQPRDWSTANLLGDLYLRAGQSDKAVAQFARIADNLSSEGFWPKAAALYKKIIRIRPDDEHAWMQAGEMAARQGVLVDARACLNTVAERRLARGDREGAAQIRVRIASLDPSDFDARRAAARARVAMGDLPGAIRDFKAIAADLSDQGRPADTVAALREAAELDPDDQSVREPLFSLSLAAGDLEAAEKWASTPDHWQKLGQAHVDRGDIAPASRFLTAETAAHDPVLLLKVAVAKLLAGARDDGLNIFRRLLNHQPARSHEIALIGCELARSAPDAGFAVVEIAAETSVIGGDWASAAAVLQEFLARLPHHIPALMRLVEICVDGGLDSTLDAAESQLADAYLAAGVGAEARVIAEDLIARCPSEPSHVDQLRLALVMLGESDPDRIIAERLTNAAPDETRSDLETVSEPPFEAAAIRNDGDVWLIPDATAAAGAHPSEEKATVEAVDDAIEIDLSDLLGDFTSGSGQTRG